VPITASHGHTSTVFAVARRRAGERGSRGSDRAGVGQPGTGTWCRMAVTQAPSRMAVPTHQRSVVLACARVSAGERCLVDDQIIFRRQERGNWPVSAILTLSRLFAPFTLNQRR